MVDCLTSNDDDDDDDSDIQGAHQPHRHVTNFHYSLDAVDALLSITIKLIKVHICCVYDNLAICVPKCTELNL